MSMARAARLSEIGQIAMNVHELDRAIAFYRDVLGVRFLFQAPGMAFFDCAGVRLVLGTPETPEFDHPGSVPYFRVDAIQTAHGRLREAGVEFLGDPHLVAKLPGAEVWMAFFRDGEGNTLALMSEVLVP